MLNAKETSIVMRMAAMLRAPKPPAAADAHALAAEADDMLVATAAARAAMAEAATGRASTGKVGAPGKLYIVEAEPGWRQTVEGAKAAVDLVNEELRKERMAAVNENSVRVTIARNGAWWKNVETTNGTVTLTIRKAKETGTNIASAQSEHKSETNPELGTTE